MILINYKTTRKDSCGSGVNNPNQLQKVTDGTIDPNGFKDDTIDGVFATDTDDYAYDSNGNMTRDDNKGINNIIYNHLNLPTQISFSNGTITYLYTAAGKKVKKTVLEDVTQTVTDYMDGYQYKEGKLQYFPTAEGYVNFVKDNDNKTYKGDYNYVYNYTDHLGNIRVSYAQDPVAGVLKIIEENHYYPFGLKHSNYNSDRNMYIKQDPITGLEDPDGVLVIKPVPPFLKTGYNYRYNSKEFQDELGLNLYDYGARNYDPALGRWMNIDPLAEIARRFSPYTYANNNPVYFIDPDGMKTFSGLGAKSANKIEPNGEEQGKNDYANGYSRTNGGRNLGSSSEQSDGGEDDQEKQKGVTPVNEKNKKNISKSSYGETAGLYPVKTGKDKNGKEIKPKNKDLFNPNSWDADLLKQLLKARAAINLLAARGASLHTDSPDLNDPIEKLLAAYHLTDNLPEVDAEIKDDKDVMFFYLSSDKNKKTPSISSKYWDQTTVKTYGPFYSIGGGDAGTGAIYLLFYKAVKKQ